MMKHGSALSATVLIFKEQKEISTLMLLLSQFKSPLILFLIFAVGWSFFLHDSANTGIIPIIILVSGLLGFRSPSYQPKW